MSNTKNLVHLANRVADLEQALLENDGVLPPELEEQFDLSTGELREKIDRYKYVIDAFESRAEYFKKMEADVKAAKKIFDNQAERLRDRLKYVMNAGGETELVGHDWRFKLSNAKEKLVVGKEVPDEFMKDVVVREVDKESIITSIKMGFPVAGCELVPSQSMRVYVNAGTKARPVKEIEE